MKFSPTSGVQAPQLGVLGHPAQVQRVLGAGFAGRLLAHDVQIALAVHRQRDQILLFDQLKTMDF